jgi:hypothetical protein
VHSAAKRKPPRLGRDGAAHETESGHDYANDSAKSTTKTKISKKHRQDKRKKHHQDGPKKHLDIIKPVGVVGVVGEEELKVLLRFHKQSDWLTGVRVCGLLILIDFIIRKLKKGVASISGNLARSYVSRLRKGSRPGMITEPLSLLCRVGIIERVRPAVFAHVKTSAVYRLGEKYRGKQRQIKVFPTPKLAAKRANADQRYEQRLNRKYLYRGQLMKDLNAVSLAPEARTIIAKGINGKGEDNLKRLVGAIDGPNHFIRISECGQITTSIGSCPRELQRHLALHGERTVSCDIAHAHCNFLPLILANRLRHISEETGREKYILDGWREHDRLTLLLSDGDFYRNWCVDPKDEAERDGKKKVLNILLNKPNQECQQNRLYRRIADHFRITFRVIEDIKGKDHRNLAKQLQRFTADAIAAALLEVQHQDIGAIPLVDALICQEKHRERVCEVLGRQIFFATGVCPKVGGTRYSPLTEEEEWALAFDETAPSDDCISYDQWEAIRIVKCAAALKLMRRCPPLFSTIALAAHRRVNPIFKGPFALRT